MSLNNITQWFFCIKLISSYRKLNKELNQNIFKEVKICLIANDITFDNLYSFLLKKEELKQLQYKIDLFSQNGKYIQTSLIHFV